MRGNSGSGARHRSWNDDLVFTNHARERMAQRGVTREMVFLAISYGTQYAARNGGIAYHLDARAVALATRDGFCTAKCRDVAVVVKEEVIVVTVERVTENPTTFKWCGL